MELTIHNNINKTLNKFIEENKIPNIIFHGPTGSGKRCLVNTFIKKIYNNDQNAISQYVLYVECAHGKGIKFIREDLKFFAKSHINIHSKNNFKTIVMANADKLTIDAQSALRRCIEVYNHTTRFFIIIEDKYKLLKPILSRFSQIYVPSPTVNNEKININKYNNTIGNNIHNDQTWLIETLTKKSTSQLQIMNKANKLYERGFSVLNLLKFIEHSDIDDCYKWSILLIFNKIKKEYRNEKLLIFYILNYLYFRLDESLENVLIM